MVHLAVVVSGFRDAADATRVASLEVLPHEQQMIHQTPR
jgi:hypothetical protein